MYTLDVNYTTVPTFNQFDIQVRTTWSESKGKDRLRSYNLWGDEALIPTWANFIGDLNRSGTPIPDQVERCLVLMDLDSVLVGDVIDDPLEHTITAIPHLVVET